MKARRNISVAICFLIILIPVLCLAEPVCIPVSKVSGGESHTFILTESNSVFGCGNNYYWELGDNTRRNRHVPVQVHGVNDINYLQNIQEIAAGWKHSLAISADSNHYVLAFGDNGVGELGNNREPPADYYSAFPIYVHAGEMNTPSGFLEHINCISAGKTGSHSLCADACGLCWSFGYNDCGQLGNGDTTDQYSPVKVHGENNDVNGLANIIAVSAGTDHSMALEKIDPNDANCTGRVYTFGSNNFSGGKGKLGINDTQINESNFPVTVHGVNNIGHLQNIVAISAGLDHSMALEKIVANDANCKGRVYCWGANGGRLGNDSYNDSAVPVMVHAGEQDPNSPDANLQNIIAISAGESHCIALEKLDSNNDPNCRGRVYCWGSNTYGQLGTGNYSPSIMPVRVIAPDRNGDGLPDDLDGDPNTTDYLGDDVPIVFISAGYWHSIAVDQSGQTYIWGKGLYGRLGTGSTNDAFVPMPLYVYDLKVYNETKNRLYKDIQPAINEADNNDVIIVYEGSYGGDADFDNKPLTLKSVDPNNWLVVNNTRIYGSGFGGADDSGSENLQPIITMTNNSGSEISGLTITMGASGIYCSNSNPIINRCRIENNAGSGLYCISGSVTLINTFISNSSYNGGIYSSGTNIVVDRCNIADNTGGNYGSGISVLGGSAVVKNSIIHHNNSHGIYLKGILPSEIRNNTIAYNSSCGIYKYSGNDPNINSNIIWGNYSSLYNIPDGNKVNYNCIQGSFSGGTGNINENPRFRDVDANDYHLTVDSNCIDSGDPNFSSSTERDIDGEDRVIDGNDDDINRVDMGADEFYFCSGRVDIAPNPPDGIVNFLDFAVLANAWLTGSGNDEVDFVDDGVIDNKDLNVFCDCWLYATSWYLYNYQQSLGGEGMSMDEDMGDMNEFQMEEIPADSDQMAESQEDQTASIYLFSEVNEPNSGDEVTVLIYTDTPLFCMMAGITVTGDANITGAMSTADCNAYGWDPGWDSEPYIDPAGWVCISGVIWPGETSGVVGYVKICYNSGEVTVSIMTESEAFDPNCEPVPFSTGTLTFGTSDPNEP